MWVVKGVTLFWAKLGQNASFPKTLPVAFKRFRIKPSLNKETFCCESAKARWIHDAVNRCYCITLICCTSCRISWRTTKWIFATSHRGSEKRQQQSTPSSQKFEANHLKNFWVWSFRDILQKISSDGKSIIKSVVDEDQLSSAHVVFFSKKRSTYRTKVYSCPISLST